MDLPIDSMMIFHSYVNIYQRVLGIVTPADELHHFSEGYRPLSIIRVTYWIPIEPPVSSQEVTKFRRGFRSIPLHLG